MEQTQLVLILVLVWKNINGMLKSMLAFFLALKIRTALARKMMARVIASLAIFGIPNFSSAERIVVIFMIHTLTFMLVNRVQSVTVGKVTFGVLKRKCV